MKQSEISLITARVKKLYSEIPGISIPINPISIINHLDIKLIKYSELPIIDIVKAIETSEDGFCGLIKGEWVIFYNDTLPINRVRFTLMHELGHIVLGHTASDRESERQANLFASMMLMPRDIVIDYLRRNRIDIGNKERVVEELSRTFVVSKASVRIALLDIRRRMM